MKKRTIPIAVLIMVSAVLTSCASNMAKDSAMPEADYQYSEAAKDYGYSGGVTAETYAVAENESYDYKEMADVADSTANVTDTRKIVRTMSLELETKTFDEAVAKIQSSVVTAGGYIEASYVTGSRIESVGDERNASFTLRIPAAGLDSYVASLGEGFNVISKQENSTDITDQYYDAEARLKSLETQEERLLSMLEGATELEYMLKIEENLSNVRYEIESYYSSLQRYDKQVSLSTLTVSLREVIEYQPVTVKPKTFGERIGTAFTNSWSDFADNCRDFSVSFVYAIPTLLIWAAIIAVIVLIVRAIIKKRRAKKSEDR